MAKSDGVVIAADRPMTEEFKRNLNRQQSGLHPEGARAVATGAGNETVPVSVARGALYRHMAFLERKISAEISDPFKFAGNAPYMDGIRRQRQVMIDSAMAAKEQARAELESLRNLDDAEIVQWAVTNGHVRRHVNGGWAVR